MSAATYAKSKKKVCCDCAAVTTTKRCETCVNVRRREYDKAYGRKRRAELYATRPPKKCSDCGEDILGRNRRAILCFECARKRSNASAAAWRKTPARRTYLRDYRRTPEYRAKSTVRNRSQKMVAYRKEYHQRPEVIARSKAWRSSPEGKESNRLAQRKYQAKKKKMKDASLTARSEAGKRLK